MRVSGRRVLGGAGRRASSPDWAGTQIDGQEGASHGHGEAAGAHDAGQGRRRRAAPREGGEGGDEASGGFGELQQRRRGRVARGAGKGSAGGARGRGDRQRWPWARQGTATGHGWARAGRAPSSVQGSG
nr:putative glycine-rich cell wall structural protein 1 [Aegilops tauschii subsp. strangulata]